MAINVNVQDLIDFPGNIKSMTIDQVSIVPAGYEGDEQYVLKFSTSAYSDVDNRTNIPDYYITEFKSGWVRSSGFAGNSGQFALTSGTNGLLVKIDNTTSGTDGASGYYEIALEYNADSTDKNGDAIAKDLEVKIRELGATFGSADIGFKAAYENASVEYKNGKFWVVSGTVSKFYGESGSDVDIKEGAPNDAVQVLGFDLKTRSATLDSASIREALVVTECLVSGTTMTVDRNLGAVEGDCLMITDGDGSAAHIDYFQLSETPPGGTVLTFSSSALKNSYTAFGAKVQLLREQDPEVGPLPWFDNVDKITRHGVKCIVNAIDFSG